jgi:predicted nuclease with RNAse H fold
MSKPNEQFRQFEKQLKKKGVVFPQEFPIFKTRKEAER